MPGKEKELEDLDRQDLLRSEYEAQKKGEKLKFDQDEYENNLTGPLLRVNLDIKAEEFSISSEAKVDIYSENRRIGQLDSGEDLGMRIVDGHIQIESNDLKESGEIIRLETDPESGIQIKNVSHPYSCKEDDNIFRGLLEFQIEGNSLIAINELALEDYLKGVCEVSNDAPTEKQKAMAVIARSYAYHYLQKDNRKFPEKDYDASSDPDVFQKYCGLGYEKRAPNFTSAVEETRGEMVYYENKVVKTPYFNESDGQTKSAQEVWGWEDTPYLESVKDPFCKEGKGELKGHGVGLSGCGAEGMAEKGWNYVKILKYYYQGVEIKKGF